MYGMPLKFRSSDVQNVLLRALGTAWPNDKSEEEGVSITTMMQISPLLKGLVRLSQL